eukprot:UN4540
MLKALNTIGMADCVAVDLLPYVTSGRSDMPDTDAYVEAVKANLPTSPSNGNMNLSPCTAKA